MNWWLGAGRQSSRQAQRRIVGQMMIITDPDENQFETNSISEDGSSCTDSTSSSLTLLNSNKNQFYLSNEDEENDEEEDDWKPKKRKRKQTKKLNKKKDKDLFVVVSPRNTQMNLSNYLLPFNKMRWVFVLWINVHNGLILFSPVTKHVVIPMIPLPVSSSNSERIFFKSNQVSSLDCDSSNYAGHSPLNLVDEDQSSVIIFKEDIQNQI